MDARKVNLYSLLGITVKYGHIANLSKARYKLIDDLKMASWGAHDLRRIGRTMLSEIGVAPNIAERILNYSMGKIEGIYDIFSYLPQKVEAMDELSGEVNQLIKL